MTTQVTTEISGLVTKVNPGREGSNQRGGFLLDGREGWLNISLFADPAVTLPAPADYVVCGIDGKGYVRTITVTTPGTFHTTAQNPLAPPVPFLAGVPEIGAGLAVEELRLRCLALAEKLTLAYTAPLQFEEAIDRLCYVAQAIEAWVTR